MLLTFITTIRHVVVIIFIDSKRKLELNKYEKLIKFFKNTQIFNNSKVSGNIKSIKKILRKKYFYYRKIPKSGQFLQKLNVLE